MQAKDDFPSRTGGGGGLDCSSGAGRQTIRIFLMFTQHRLFVPKKIIMLNKIVGMHRIP